MTVSTLSRLVLAAALVAAIVGGGTSLIAGDAISAAQAPNREPTPAARPAPPVPYLEWTDCGNGFQCANAKVPLDYDRPLGRTIDIALIRRPALDQAQRIGSAFLNPGGPDMSGVEFVRTAPPPAFQVLSRFDVVGFDWRGFGSSRPAVADCGVNPAYRRPFPRYQEIDEQAFLSEVERYVKRCVERNPDILPHLSSANVARDLDLLRAAVGDERLTYLGASYGAMVGATYASLFPRRARALVLDSPTDVQSFYDRPLEVWRDYAKGHEDTLERFLSACASSRGACGFGGADPKAALERLLARLDLEGVPSADPSNPHKLSGDDVRLVLEDTLRARARWPAIAAGLRQAEAGDSSALWSLRMPVTDANDDFATAVFAADQKYRRRPLGDYFAVAARSHAEFKHFWYRSGYMDLVHALWPVDDYDAFQGRIHNSASAAPVLVIGTTHDPATPYVQAQRLVKDLGNARLLSLDGDGHGAATSFDPCVIGALVDYVNDGILPAKDAVCVQRGDPFPPATAEAKAGEGRTRRTATATATVD